MKKQNSQNRLFLSFKSDPQNIDDSVDKIVSFVQQNKIPVDNFDLNVVLYELLSNSVKHGNKNNPAKNVDLTLILDKNKFNIEIKDQGAGFDPDIFNEQKENPLEPHGMGLMIIKSLGYSMVYDQNKMQLNIEKRFQ